MLHGAETEINFIDVVASDNVKIKINHERTNSKGDEKITSGTLHRLTAFSKHIDGGNPAGVWVGEALPDAHTMQHIATEVGFSETVFVAPSMGFNRTVRYFSLKAEVPFCGHATIAAGAVLAEANGDGIYRLSTNVGEVPVHVHTRDGFIEVSLTSVEPTHTSTPDTLINETLSVLGWKRDDLDDSIPCAKIYAGAWHLLLAVSTANCLEKLDYDFEKLKAIMLNADLTTLQLVWREKTDVFHSRNPFPVGGVVEDSATGAAAAALGGYLRATKLIPLPSTFIIRQGEAMGRPSRLTVDVPKSGGIVVTGTAIRL